jgi:hypothetical protein
MTIQRVTDILSTFTHRSKGGPSQVSLLVHDRLEALVQNGDVIHTPGEHTTGNARTVALSARGESLMQVSCGLTHALMKSVDCVFKD